MYVYYINCPSFTQGLPFSTAPDAYRCQSVSILSVWKPIIKEIKVGAMSWGKVCNQMATTWEDGALFNHITLSLEVAPEGFDTVRGLHRFGKTQNDLFQMHN